MTKQLTKINTKMQQHFVRSSAVFRDLSQGRVSTYAASNDFINTNATKSVSMAYNVSFDSILGSAQARAGSTAMGSAVQAGESPLGLYPFTGLGGSPNNLLAFYAGASYANLSYWNGTTWTGSTSFNALNWSNTAKIRCETLGGLVYAVNGISDMVTSADGITWGVTNQITSGIHPSLVKRYGGVMLAAGVPTNTDRIYFSSVCSLTASPTITWNTDGTVGNWLDVNPDDGDNITGFMDISGTMLVFKNNGFYRLDTVAKSVDPELVYDAGAPSQEAITRCQGNVYYFSGTAIYSTNGGYPTQISRLGVQDFIDAVPQANWSIVCAGHDTFSVYFSLGQVTVQGFTNYIVLKYSTRDQSWTVYYYPTNYQFFATYTGSDGQLMRGADTAGYVRSFNKGLTDDGTPIFHSLETQEMEFANVSGGGRETTKEISDKIAVFTRNGGNSRLEVKEDDHDYREITKDLTRPFTILEDLGIKGRYIKFKWSGTSTGSAPVFEGIAFPKVNDSGVINDELT